MLSVKQNDQHVKDAVHPNWSNCQNFAKWFHANHVDGWQLDKDVLVDGNHTKQQRVTDL